MAWDFSEYTDAELATLSTTVKSKLTELVTGPQSGTLDGGSFSEMKLSELKELQGAINAELRSRSTTYDDDFIAVEFEEASD